MSVVFGSTNRKSEDVDFKLALLRGQAPDKGLYTPKNVPLASMDEIMAYKDMPYHKIAYDVLSRYIGDLIPPKILRSITTDSYDFDVPLENIFERTYIMRLDRGPTASFKDFAARAMARMVNFFLEEDERSITILTATSGDTGSAVANAFHGFENIKIVVLFPRDEVTAMQRRQMTTLGGNVSTIAVDGKFDDCQALVKKAFSDPELEGLDLSSANSINIGRLLPQSVYYFWAYSKLFKHPGEEIVFSIPSGNFGDLMGGLLAKKMGLPVDRFIVATNENDEFPRYLETGVYNPLTPSRACVSNAMNVGHPSNLARVFYLYEGWMDEVGKVVQEPNLNIMRRDLWSISVTDEQTRHIIKTTYQDYGVILEPHGAVGFKALLDYTKKVGSLFAVSLETADPAKFPEEIVKSIGIQPQVPKSLEGLEHLQENYSEMPNDYSNLKSYLLRMHSD